MRAGQLNIILVVVTLMLEPVYAAPGSIAWPGGLLYSGGGFWRTRIAILIESTGNEPEAGRLLELRVGSKAGELPLAGLATKSLRVCNEQRTEYLFQVTPANSAAGGAAERFADGDVVRFAVDLEPHRTATYYVYADNPNASTVPDFLSAQLANGGFESGSASAPLDWTGGAAGDNWVAQYLLSGGRGNSRCVYVRGAKGTVPPRMIRWAQQGILVNEGGRYSVRGWVRAKNVTGNAGWMIQVNGAVPNYNPVMNRTGDGGSGTYDWREVSTSFVVPKGGHTLDVATVLSGSGEAWYDDVTLAEDASTLPSLHLSVGAPERMEIQSSRGSDAWEPLGGEGWRARAELRVVRLESEPAKQILVTAEIRRAINMLFYLTNTRRGPISVRVVDPVRKRVLPSAAIGDRVGFWADLPGRSDQHFFVYLAPATEEAAVNAYTGLIAGRANLARAADFEDSALVEKNWLPEQENGKPVAIKGEISDQGIVGRHALRVAVSPDAPLQWAGSRQVDVPVRPGATYLLAGYVRTERVQYGEVDLSGTFISSAGTPIEGTYRFRTGTQVFGDQPWISRSGIVVTPPECSNLELELGMRARGTAMFDGILFAEAAEAAVTATRPFPGAASARDLAAWSVNPMVKIFSDDPPRDQLGAVSIYSARNEWEPLQIGVWSRKALKNVRAEISELRNSSGKALPPARSFRIETVDVDLPTGYYTSRVPEWIRRIAIFQNGHMGGANRWPDPGRNSFDVNIYPRRTDGWPGQWPDPLPPLRPFDLAAGQTQGLWFDIFVPEAAAPGDYQGTIAIQAEGAPAARLPVHLTVWDFALPAERHLRVVYDLGVRGNDTEVLRRWFQFLAEHRVSPDSMRPMPVFSIDEQGDIKMDANQFDELAPYYFNELHHNWSYMPRTLYGVQWAQPLRPFMGFEPHTPAYEKAFKTVFKMFVDHVTERGWRDKFVYYLSDEPHFQNPQVVENLRYMINMAREVAPDVLIYSSTWRHSPALDGYLSLWGIGQYGCFPVEILQERLKAGDKAMFTTDGQQALDTPYLATERLLPAYCYKYGVSGHEFWGVSRWAMDVWKRSWENFHRQTNDGKQYYWIRYPNGDGYLAYPGEPVGVQGPVSSLRLKAVREGSEDYEYYFLLDKAVANARKRGLNSAAAERALDAVRDLVSIPNHGGFVSTDIMPDPDAIYRVRRQIAEEIVRLKKQVEF